MSGGKTIRAAVFVPTELCATTPPIVVLHGATGITFANRDAF
jgi:poly(3-hydroxybutyrate) depolymerase